MFGTSGCNVNVTDNHFQAKRGKSPSSTCQEEHHHKTASQKEQAIPAARHALEGRCCSHPCFDSGQASAQCIWQLHGTPGVEKMAAGQYPDVLPFLLLAEADRAHCLLLPIRDDRRLLQGELALHPFNPFTQARLHVARTQRLDHGGRSTLGNRRRHL